MRKIVALFTLTILFGCEDVIQVDFPTSESRLVIDALIGFNQSNGDPIVVGEVRLTLTAPFLREGVPPADNATVEIIDEQTGQSYPLNENEPGVFNTGFPDLQFDRNYTLIVTYQGETYTASERLSASPTLVGLEQGEDFLFDEEEETEVLVTFTDIPNERNHYLFSFGFDNFLVIDDEFFQDSQLTFSYFYENVDPGDLLTVTVFGIDERFANFMEQALTQSGENGGGPFALPTAMVRGNIINNTNSDNFPFGYFAISEFDVDFLTVE
ncbi:DUF4249 family protein [Flagellimonas allohymeniacidonis]|uniref:DUF4249 domain-containing protein n=1 Tax=Flagellimonas allohymeniacidonis TaxID=2517819 RepID=A0A4V6MMB4_9FLAO|nr:DUF4249 family protein [Allomuricauda hymeniacidonis]TAI49100.1 DUF4249 domain-containing protein [Allomuricauda hymeniacidonis]